MTSSNSSEVISNFERILKSIRNKEAQISKKDITNYFDSGNILETIIQFNGNALLKVELE